MDEQLRTIPGFEALSRQLAMGERTSRTELQALADAGFRHVIDLLPAPPAEAVPGAAGELACSSELEYLHLPFDFEMPRLATALQLFDELERRAPAPVFVRSPALDRASSLLTVYRIARQGADPRAARAEHVARTEVAARAQLHPTWRRFVTELALKCVPRPLRFETVRLVLRDALPTDAEPIQRYAGDPEVCRLMIWGPNTLEQTLEFLQFRVSEQQRDPERRAFELLLEEKTSGEVIGSAGLRVGPTASLDGDLGYVLARSHWGRGLVPEACEKLLDIAFGLFALHRVWASADADNRPSHRVLEKLGMRREAHFKADQLVKGRYRDTVVYALTEDEYWARPLCKAYA